MDLRLPCLCLVTDRTQCEGRLLVDVVDAAVSGGVNMVQLREKDLPSNQLYALALELRRATQGRALLMINDRIDIAMACEADGVQLGEEGLPVETARRLANGKLLLSRSVHSLEGAINAQKSGADMIVLGTIFPSGSHPCGATGGLDLVRDVSNRINIPLLAIGGITKENIGQVIEAGTSGSAVITSITRSTDPENAARSLVEQMGPAWASNASTRATRRP